MSSLSALCFGHKVKLISYYAKVELFKVASENSRRRPRSHPIDPRFFARFVLEGQINAALRFLDETTLALTDGKVMTQLKQKHPIPQPGKLGSLIIGPIDDE